VSENRIPQGGGTDSAEHGDLKLRGDLATFNTQGGCSKNLIGVRVNDGFQKSASFANLERSRDLA
jgi:hypothetical protein